MDVKPLAAVIFRFTARFLRELDRTNSVISSPLSTEILLALLTLATSDPAHGELLHELGFQDDDAIRSSFSTLTSQLAAIKGVTLDVANKLYLKEGLELEPTIKEDASIIQADIEQINFGDPTAAVKLINDWVENITHNKIKNIITERDIQEDIQLILLNAIYFKGNWRTQFDPAKTVEMPFRVDDNTTILVNMMRYDGREFRYRRSVNLSAEILELPYVGDEAKMIFVLPHGSATLSDVLEKLAKGHDLMAELDGTFAQKVYITLPKFKIETEINLKTVLQQLGIKSIFNGYVDKILKNKTPLQVSGAFQKAYIEVNEQGTEACAVSKMRLHKLSGPKHFNANRPFLYALVGRARVTLFAGLYRGDVTAARTDRELEDSFKVVIETAAN